MHTSRCWSIHRAWLKLLAQIIRLGQPGLPVLRCVNTAALVSSACSYIQVHCPHLPLPIIIFCPLCMQSLLGDSDGTIVIEATRLVCSSLSILTAEQACEPRPAAPELQPAGASTLLSKRARSDSLTDPPLPGWVCVYESILDLATKHRNPLARAAAMEGLCQVQMC